jgi:hypothetical protein
MAFTRSIKEETRKETRKRMRRIRTWTRKTGKDDGSPKLS